MTAPPPDPSSADFLRRALRWLAILCLAYCGVTIVNHAVFLAVQGPMRFSMGWRSGSGWQRLDAFALICSTAAMLTLGVGAYGLLRWKRWSRIVLIVAAGSIVGFSLISNIGWFIIFSGQITNARATTRFVGPPVWFYAWTTFVQWILQTALPVVVLWTMVQREVADLWARRGEGGFDVIPTARAVEGNAP